MYDSNSYQFNIVQMVVSLIRFFPNLLLRQPYLNQYPFNKTGTQYSYTPK